MRKSFLMLWGSFAYRSQASGSFSLEKDWSLVTPAHASDFGTGRGNFSLSPPFTLPLPPAMA